MLRAIFALSRAFALNAVAIAQIILNKFPVLRNAPSARNVPDVPSYRVRRWSRIL